MLYLEDYLEMIEHLPQELRDRFTEIREMDLSVQNNMDSLDKQLRLLFGECRRGEVTGDALASQFAELQRGYGRTEEEAEEKVQLATQMYELVLRYIRRLDSELHKFKCELEADNKGVTELLEKRSLELDAPAHTTVPAHQAPAPTNHYRDSRYRVRAEKRRDSWGAPRESSRSHSNTTTLSRTDSAIQAALGRESYSLGHAGSAIAAAASQAIAATQQMQQGRRTASLKASYEAVSGGGSELAGAAHHALHATHHYGHGAVASGAAHGSSSGHHSSHTHSHSSSSNKRHKKKSNSSYASSSGAGHSQQSLAASRSSSPTVASVASGAASGLALEEAALTDSEWTYDPNEPRYCVCNQVSYGDMVACDNEECPYEWFHYPCVGITAPPKGKWYCPQCNTNMRRNRSRKN